MRYIVWSKTEYGGWEPADCDDMSAVKGEILAASKEGKEVLLTQVLEFSLDVKVRPAEESKPPAKEKAVVPVEEEIKQEVEIGVTESKPKTGKSTRG